MPDRPVPRATRRTWVVGFGELTPEQRQVVLLPTTRHQFVSGPAGSGKTLLALHRTRRLLDEGVPESRLRALVFTRVLRSYIKSGTEALEIPESVVGTYNQWVTAVAREQGVRLPGGADFTERFAAAERTLREHFERARPGPVLDVAIVDEGQDLSAEAYRLLTLAARHVTVFADDAQRLYEQGLGRGEGLSILGVPRESAGLLKNLRNSAGVSRVAHCFLDADQAEAYRRAGHYLQRPGQMMVPALYRAPSIDAEWDRLAAIVKREIERNARVAILMPTNRLVGSCANRLRERGVDPVETVVAWESDDARFNDLTPKVLTVHSAKGLSFDSVLIPRLTPRAYGHMQQGARTLLFVGVARALEWVYLSTVQGEELPEIGLLAPALRQGHIEELGEASRGHAPARQTEFDDIPL